jgi:uncharacterized membrane protein YfcA
VFAFPGLEAVILNKAMSLIVVAFALPFRSNSVPFGDVAGNWPAIINLLAGSLLGAWCGAGWAIRLSHKELYPVIAVLLVLIAVALMFGHNAANAAPALTGVAQMLTGVVAGFAIGVVASLLLIPTLVLLFGADIKLAGSLSLAVSLPTMVVAFTRYSRDRSCAVITNNRRFVLAMATGSIAGSFIGGHMLGFVPSSMLLPLLATILVVSAVKVWRRQ